MKRFLVVFVAVILIVACMVCSVSAAVVQPTRFIASVRDAEIVDDDAVCSINANKNFIYLLGFYRDGDNVSSEDLFADGFYRSPFSDSFTATSTSSMLWRVTLYYANVVSNGTVNNPVYFPLSGIVDGNVLSVDVRVGEYCPTNATYSSFRVRLYDANGNYYTRQGTYSRYEDSNGYWHYVGTYTFDDIDPEFVNYVPEFEYYREGTQIQKTFDIDMDIEHITVSMPISQYNDLSNAEVGDQLDDMINRPVTPEPPEGSGSVDDYHDIESGLLDDTEAGRNEALSALGSIGVIYGFMTSFTYLVGICELFFGLPLITELLTVSLALSVFILLFNLFTDIDRRVRSGKKESAKGKYAKKAHKGGHK